MMVINNKWSIRPESNGGVVLVFAEERIRKDGKNKGEPYLYEDSYYYPTIYTALKAYTEKQLEVSEDVKDCIKIIENTFEKLKEIVVEVELK